MAVALVALVVAPAQISVAGAQVSAGAPLGLSAPSWTATDLPAEMRISSMVVLPGPDGAPSALDVRFASAFTPPGGRWRVSVGIGDPAGVWQRLTMVWDGSASTGIAEEIDGLAVTALGPVTSSVDPAGSVVLGVPAGVLDAAGGGVVWAESVLGEDTDPTLLVRTPWFPRAVLTGEGSPGLLQGSTLGVPVPATPGGAAPNSAPAVIDTGVPTVLELAGGVLTIDSGAGPAELGGGPVRSVVDLVTLVGSAGGADTAPNGPQVRIDLLGGSVELGVGTVLGPLAPAVGDDRTVPPSDEWLQQSDVAGATGTTPLEVDVAGAFAAVGQQDPGSSLAVTVTRVVTGADGSVVAAPGVMATADWMTSGLGAGPVRNATATAGSTADAGASEGAPLGPIAIGLLVGAVLVGGAMAISGRRHRRSHPGPEDVPLASTTQDDHGAPVPDWDEEFTGGDLGFVPGSQAASGVATQPTPSSAPPAGGPAGSSAGPSTEWAAPSPSPSADAPATGPEASPESSPTPDTVRPSGIPALDDELDDLSERLRRLGVDE